MPEDKKKNDGVILQQITGPAQVINKALDLAKHKPWLLAGILALAAPATFFGGKAWLDVEAAKKEKVDTVINIAGGDPAEDEGDRNPYKTALRESLENYPADIPIKVVEYFPDEDGSLLAFDMAATPGLTLSQRPKLIPEPQLQAHEAGNCYQLEQVSSCPVVDSLGNLKAFAEVEGATVDAEAFLQSGAEVDGLETTNLGLIKVITGDAE